MKILSLTAQKPHGTGSGVYLSELVKAWDENGHEQMVICGLCPNDKYSFPSSVKCVPVYYESEELPFPVCGMSDEMPYSSTKYSDMTMSMVNQFKAAFMNTIIPAVEQFKPDVIICHHLYLLTAFVLEAFSDKKIIVINHGSDTRQIQKNTLLRDFIIEQCRKASRVVVLKDLSKLDVIKIYGFPPNKVDVIGSGYNHRIFHIDDSIQRDDKKIIYAGKLSHAKGVYNLLKALDRLPYNTDLLRITMAGGANNPVVFKEISDLANKSKYKITLTGAISQIQLAQEMCSAKVFVLPSFYEGSPLVLLEALACGCTVVCSDLPGLRKYYNTVLPDNDIIFVPMPRMVNIDEPLEEDLEQFERDLADGLIRALDMPDSYQKQLKDVSWDSISNKILPKR